MFPKSRLEILVALCLLYNHVYGYEKPRVSERIIDGTEAKIEDFPFFASLWNCGAAILSDTWIVTAAHCVSNMVSPDLNIIWVGGESFENSKMVSYKRVVIHPNYNTHIVLTNDVALIQLSEPLTFSSKIQPVKLPTGTNFDHEELDFVGRGRDETGKSSRSIMMMDVTRLTTSECVDHLPMLYQVLLQPHIAYLEEAIICAKRLGDRPGLCNGDSGGPLVQEDTLVGLASFGGEGNCRDLRLGFYANVATFVPWIKSVTGLK